MTEKESLWDALKNVSKIVDSIADCLETTNESLNIIADTEKALIERIEKLENRDEIKTNADRVRHMSDEELLETIYQHMGNAAACPDCFQRNGKERLKLWLEMENREN